MLISLFLAIAGIVRAEQQTLTLADCRSRALSQNKQSLINQENAAAAAELRKAAVAKFFPKASANGAYMYVQNNLYLLPDHYEFPFGVMNADGTFVINDDAIQTRHFNYADLRELFPTLDEKLTDWMAQEYTKARDLSELDIHNVFVVQAGVTQPIFMGGKLIELYKIARATEQMANLKQENQNDELLLSVDEAYWRVISVEQKYLLATQYCALLQKADSNIMAAIEEGTMTKSDLLKMRVALNEAQMNRQKAEDGLVLAKMALCQLIGMPLDSDIRLDDSELDTPSLKTSQDIDMERTLQNRREIQMLEEAEKIARSGVMLTASTLMPNVVAGANYVATSPNLFNGYQNKLGGTFTAGVVVNVPIAHADDIYQLRAAKHKARTIELQLQEAREKIELQVTQAAGKLNAQNQKLLTATANTQTADENLRLAQEAFSEGMLTSTELLGAQTAWLRAYSEKTDAAIELRMAEVYLKKYAGN